ncbi:MAG: hypothetical protein IT364_01940 [Candidatus Hydrogenedentes bacterium]|nr:hypothetical protein [Candidatus Hydrogenedentota bacterium]
MRIFLGLLACVSAAVSPALAQGPAIPVGTSLQPLIDNYLIQGFKGKAQFELHSPVPREIVLVTNEPWEGNSCNYFTVFQDGPLYRMYYKADEQVLKDEPPAHRTLACYAESTDGVHWTKPKLGLFEYEGSKDNNIIWDGEGAHDFSPFIDSNPACPPEARYKSVSHGKGGLTAFQSADGIHWGPLQDAPIITDGAFDSDNVAFWDTLTGEYRVYFRAFRDGLRDIKTAVSKDFVTWSEATWLEYPGAPKEQLYTNGVLPYFRAPQIYLGFPTRYIDRGWSASSLALPEPEHRTKRYETSAREGSALTDGLFMTSRDGRTFHRWTETFIKPGLRTAGNWVYGDNYQCWGVVTTKAVMEEAPDELSVYATEGYWTGDDSRLRRFTLRMDGFVSVHAPMTGGEIMTRPIVFEGRNLALNFSTSAAGTIRIEILDEAATPIEGFTLDDAPEIFGDNLNQVVTWKDGKDLLSLAGKPIRLRFVLNDADVYAFQFQP